MDEETKICHLCKQTFMKKFMRSKLESEYFASNLKSFLTGVVRRFYCVDCYEEKTRKKRLYQPRETKDGIIYSPYREEV
ncbi:MAG: hypothetical protein ACW99Q_23590 [Candidatus Kariarchaeaceae archaeon]|jgi:formate-dependent nitrite reductase cytochrome c552 subunit